MARATANDIEPHNAASHFVIDLVDSSISEPETQTSDSQPVGASAALGAFCHGERKEDAAIDGVAED